jgi:hypothetical protein
VKWHRADRLFYVQEPTGDFKGYIININVPVVYVARDVLILMRATSIARAIGRVCPENRDFLDPELATSEASAIWVCNLEPILNERPGARFLPLLPLQ